MYSFIASSAEKFDPLKFPLADPVGPPIWYAMTEGVHARCETLDVVEAVRVSGGRRIGVHRDLPVIVSASYDRRKLRHQGVQTGLVRGSRSLEVDVHAVEVLRSQESDDLRSEGGAGGGIGCQLVERRLVEALQRQHDSSAGGMRPVDQVRKILALISRPAVA